MTVQVGKLGDTFVFNFGVNDTSGTAADFTGPTCDVRLQGAAASAAPVHSPTPFLLTDAGYPAGAGEVSVTASSGNGFSSGNIYGVFVQVTADSQSPLACIGYIDLALAR